MQRFTEQDERLYQADAAVRAIASAKDPLELGQALTFAWGKAIPSVGAQFPEYAPVYMAESRRLGAAKAAELFSEHASNRAPI